MLTVEGFALVCELKTKVFAKFWVNFDLMITVFQVPLDHVTTFLKIIQCFFNVLVFKLGNIHKLVQVRTVKNQSGLCALDSNGQRIDNFRL